MNLILYGTLYQKGNSRRIVFNKRTRKPMVIKSDKALSAFNSFVMQAQAQKTGEPLKGLLSLRATIYYPDNRHDLEDSMLCDALQKAEIIENDRQIVEKILYKKFDKEKPRIELIIEET